MTLSERAAELVRAAFPGTWVVSHEHDDAIAELAGLCRDRGWALATWDLERGLAAPGIPAAGPGDGDAANAAIPAPVDGSDPIAALRALARLAPPEGDGATLLVMRNLHRLLGSPELVQALDAALARGKRLFIIRNEGGSRRLVGHFNVQSADLQFAEGVVDTLGLELTPRRGDIVVSDIRR